MLKFFISILVASPVVFSTRAFATDSSSTTNEEKVDNAKRAGKKAVHRVEESVACAEGDVKCAEKKAIDRARETKDYMKDKADEKSN